MRKYLPLLLLASPAPAQAPFGTLREQSDRQQAWLAERLTTVLPALMQKHGVDMWVIPMREYNEDPVFSSIVSPTTFAARRRTIYVFFDRCAPRVDPARPQSAGGQPSANAATNVPGTSARALTYPDTACVERLALGGSSQGGLYRALRSTRAAASDVRGQQAELWGDEQWLALRDVIAERNPRRIAINVSTTHAFADGLSAGELEGMREALGAPWTDRFVRAETLALDLIATRLPDETAFYRELQVLVHELIARMFSSEVIEPGVTRTSDLVWWWRQTVHDLGLGTWFQPSIDVQRRGATAESLGDDPVIQRGDLLHCDVGITALGLNTDTQHDAYVLLEGETQAPAGLRKALANSNRLQDLLFEEVRAGRSGNQILRATLERMRAEGLDGTMYSHPIGVNGHGAGPLIGLWDRQEGVPGRGDVLVIPNMWFSSELQVTTRIPEWGGQPVRMAQEEDFLIDSQGRPSWILQRQDRLHLVR
jgi:hypothetical protein